MRRFWICLCFLTCLFATPPQASCNTVVIGPMRDGTLYQDANGALANGAGEFFFAGKNANGNIRRGLFHFDVAAAIPAGSVINSATLTLHMSQSPNATPRSIGLHPVLVNWGEGTSNSTGGGGGSGAPATTNDATWLHTFFNTSMWATAGGDFAPLASATTSVAGVADYSWSSPQLVADVQNWLNAPPTNFGWLLLGDESANQSVKRFDTRENTAFDFRPELLVNYTPVPEPGAFSLAGLGCAGLWIIRRRRYDLRHL